MGVSLATLWDVIRPPLRNNLFEVHRLKNPLRDFPWALWQGVEGTGKVWLIITYRFIDSPVIYSISTHYSVNLLQDAEVEESMAEVLYMCVGVCVCVHICVHA